MANIDKIVPAKRNIPFSPPDISELEIAEVAEALRSGWITTGPRTKEFERRLAAYCHTSRVVCLNSATASEELNFRICGIGEGDEVIVPAYTYSASASAAIHCGARVVFIDSQKDKDLFENEDLSLREISRRTNHSFNTVKKYAYQDDWGEGELPNLEPESYPVLGEFIPIIDEWLETDRKVPRKQRHTMWRMFCRLRDEHGYTGSYAPVRYDLCSAGPETFMAGWG